MADATMPDDDLPHDNMQSEALAVIIVFITASTVFIALRMWVRLAMKQFFWDDVLILAAWACAVANAGLTYHWVQVMHFGYHVWDIPIPTPAEQVYGQKYNMAQALTYNPILGLVKLSVIVFLFRLGDTRRWIRWALWAQAFFNAGLSLAVFVVALAQCQPLHMFWNQFDPAYAEVEMQCINGMAFSMTTSGMVILSDVLILLTPLIMLWHLKMPLRRKMAVIAVLSLGWVVAVIGAVRLKVFYDYWMQNDPDGTYGLGQTLSGIEGNVAIITACGPALKALITRWSPKFFGTTAAGTAPSRGPIGYGPTDHELTANARGSKGFHSATISTGLNKREGRSDSTESIVRRGSVGVVVDEVDSTQQHEGVWVRREVRVT